MNHWNCKAFIAPLFSATLLSTTAITPSLAQEANYLVDEVVVTTTRSDTSRFDHAGNVSLLDPAETANLYPVELLNRAPGVYINRGSSQEHLTSIRSPILTGGAGAGSFLYLEDGISMRAPAFANVNALLDAMPSQSGRVEVVRGPGSALYGSNALHGMINFVSAPITKDQTINRIAAGSYGRYALESEVNRLNDGFGARSSISLTGDEEGFRAQSGFEQQKLRLETEWKNNNRDYRFSLTGMNLNQETAGYIETDGDVEAYEDATLVKSNANPDAYRDSRSFRSYLRISQALDDGATLTLTPYARSNEMEFKMHFLPGTAKNSVEENAHDSVGLLVNYHRATGNVTYDVGIDTDFTQGELTEVQSGADKYQFGKSAADGAQFIDYAQGTHYDYDVDALVIAPYVHAVWAVSDTTDVTTGVRVEFTDYDYTNNTDDGLQGKLYRPANRSDDFTDVSPKLGVLHKLSDNRRLFANLARSARAPQTADLYRLRDKNKDGSVPEINDIDSETLDSLEIGYRAASASLSYEISAYVMKKKNHHFRDGNDYYESNGETEHEGLEVELLWAINQDTTLDANMTWANHEYAFNRDVSGGNALETITDGDQVDGAPKTLANATLSHATTASLTTALSWHHVGEYYMDASNTAEYEGHDLFDLTFDYDMGAQAQLQVQVQNILNEDYATRADKWFGDNRYFPGEGRRFMLSLKKSY